MPEPGFDAMRLQERADDAVVHSAVDASIAAGKHPGGRVTNLAGGLVHKAAGYLIRYVPQFAFRERLGPLG